MMKTSRIRIAAASLLLVSQAAAFISLVSPSASWTRIDAAPSDDELLRNDGCDRRGFMARLVTLGTAASIASPTGAQATYSAYSRREEDWQRRVEKGEIQVSSAKALRQQLREIAPMNSERSKIFCPNGTTSNVSPLMENKCNDKLTMPSVFGRTEDAVGNSIPGFANRDGAAYRSAGVLVEDGTKTLQAIGGFPDYSRTVSNLGSR